jgi:hypothetical protein
LADENAQLRDRPGDRNWNLIADLNKDGIINIVDISLAARLWKNSIASSAQSLFNYIGFTAKKMLAS